jgi:hypothetical protein
MADVDGIACYESHPMQLGGGREKTIDYRQRATRAQSSPFMGNRAIDRQNAFTKRPIDGYKPIIKGSRLSVILQTDYFHALSDFTDHQDA